MGWSAAAKAINTLDLIREQCIKTSGFDNQFRQDGKTYFFEIGRENRDGAITGTILKREKTSCRRSGTFRIEPNGRVERGPTFFKDIFPMFLFIDNVPHGAWFERFGGPTKENLFKRVKLFADSFKIGGVNQHISKHYGYVPYPKIASILMCDDAIVEDWTAALFQVWD